MICQNCQANVDDDLVFCTECGNRLHETLSNAQTIIIPESVVTKITKAPEKPKTSLKLVALVIGIFVVIAISAGILIGYFAFNKSNKPIANKTNSNASTPQNRKSTNQNKNTNTTVNNSSAENNWNLNSNSASNNINENSNVSLSPTETKILDERINVDPDAHIAFPFKVRESSVKISGEVEIQSGDNFEGYVFLQEVYDENGVNPDFKMFSFDTDKVEQYLTKGNYVLVFANKDGQGVSLKAKFTQIPQTNN